MVHLDVYIIALLWYKLRQKFELFRQQVYDKKVAPADWVISDVWWRPNERNLECLSSRPLGIYGAPAIMDLSIPLPQSWAERGVGMLTCVVFN